LLRPARPWSAAKPSLTARKHGLEGIVTERLDLPYTVVKSNARFASLLSSRDGNPFSRHFFISEVFF
jgi:hypothetical protein